MGFSERIDMTLKWTDRALYPVSPAQHEEKEAEEKEDLNVTF